MNTKQFDKAMHEIVEELLAECRKDCEEYSRVHADTAYYRGVTEGIRRLYIKIAREIKMEG